jgi:hypothetical protein
MGKPLKIKKMEDVRKLKEQDTEKNNNDAVVIDERN